MPHTTYDHNTIFRREACSNDVFNNKYGKWSKAIARDHIMNARCYLIGCIGLILVTIFPSSQVNAQKKVHQYIVSGSLLFAGGCSDGVTETLKFHYYDGFKRVFPKSNDQFWYPELSWQNKYKNSDPEAGPKYFGSTTVFVGLTDGYHMSRLLRNSFVFGALAFKIGEPKQKWYSYVAQFVAGGIVYKAGFWTSYELAFHQ